ncbi:MAG: hypothetical protein JWR47_1724 [Phenylobacterium sp.]|jgi:hypothetical protein|nr:hypothetical protein [Phenylobacterium sp.]
MQWSMPHRVLQVVGGLLVLVALSAFTLGVVNAPQRGRMPGERARGDSGLAPIQATEATPLSQERIEGPPPPPELTPEEKAKQEADKEARAAAKLAASGAAAPPTLNLPAPPPDKVGEILQSAPPAPEEPPH